MGTSNDIKINADIPDEASEETYAKIKQLRKKYRGLPLTDTTKAKLNREVQIFQEHLRENYQYSSLKLIRFELCGEEGYVDDVWTVYIISKVHGAYYPERKHHKEQYTRREINNMLFDLKLLEILYSYDKLYLPSIIDEKGRMLNRGDELYFGTVHVKRRYGVRLLLSSIGNRTSPM
jgi:hypothetical protein